MDVNGHADEHSRQQGEDVRLHQHDDDLSIEIADASGTETATPTPTPATARPNISVNRKTKERIARIAMCPPVMFAASRIVSAKGRTSMPITSIGMSRM